MTSCTKIRKITRYLIFLCKSVLIQAQGDDDAGEEIENAEIPSLAAPKMDVPQKKWFSCDLCIWDDEYWCHSTCEDK